VAVIDWGGGALGSKGHNIIIGAVQGGFKLQVPFYVSTGKRDLINTFNQHVNDPMTR
jgi:hypothetical protein